LGPHAQRTLVLMSKLIHCTANHVQVSIDQHMQPANVFVEQTNPELLAFLKLLVDPDRERSNAKLVVKFMSTEDKLHQADTQHKEVKKNKKEKERTVQKGNAANALLRAGFL